MGNPMMIDPKAGICWFYDANVNYPFGNCRLKGTISGSNFKKIPLRLKEPEFGYCSQKMYDYHISDCEPYPVYSQDKLSKWGEGFKLLPECGYTIEKNE